MARFMGVKFAGSAFWGGFAEHWGISRALLFASLGLMAGLIPENGGRWGGRKSWT
jgi:hypothetical protein